MGKEREKKEREKEKGAESKDWILDIGIGGIVDTRPKASIDVKSES